MTFTTEVSEQFSNPAQCDVRRICGPKFNTFGPAADRLEEPGRFFQREAWKAMSKPLPAEDEVERWDGMD
jgi:hypothetical protein